MRDIAKLLNELRGAGVIMDYAVFGAIAQMRYTEPVATLDVDVLVDLPSPERLDSLAPLYAYCANKGYHPEGEAIKVGAWPVQFIPVFSPLTRAALAAAESARYDRIPLRVVSAKHLAVIALEIGRPKDHARIVSLLQSGSVGPGEIAKLAARHGFGEKWRWFKKRFLNERD